MDVRDMILFAVIILIAIGSLFMIQAGGGVSGLGVLVFLAAVVVGFWLIRRLFDRQDAPPR